MLVASSTALAAVALALARRARARWRRARRRRAWAARPPNIVLFMTDQELAWDRLPHTFPFATALPAREALRASSVSFPAFVTATSPCTPSRAATYTGLHF